jgi:hypothetical protein
LIEDLGSSNGTFLNSPDRRVTRAVPLAETDTVYFGSLAVPAARLLSSRLMPEADVESDPPPLPEGPVLPRLTAVRPAAAPAKVVPGMIVMLAQAPVIAVLILLVFGRQAAAPITATNWPSVAQGVAATTFALALSAVWLGGSLAVWASLVGRRSRGRENAFDAGLLGSPSSKIAALGALCLIQCAVLLAIVHWGSGLRGPWPAMFGLLVLTSAVGLSLGWVVCSLIERSMIAVAVLIAVFVAMMALGTWTWATPSRWAYEGLLVQEADAGPTWRPSGAEPERVPIDLAEDEFPAETQRMGSRAAVLALGGMLGALVSFLGMRRWTAPAQRPCESRPIPSTRSSLPTR